MEENKQDKIMFEWRDAFMSEHGPKDPIMRLVLLVLATFMHCDGTHCWPSQVTIAKRSGLSVRSVERKLAIAKKNGWIKASTAGYTGQGYKHYQYEPTIPYGLKAKLCKDRGERTVTQSVSNEKRTVTQSGNVPSHSRVNTSVNTPKEYSAVVKYLNEKTGTKYKSTTKKTQAFIKARLSEGFSVENFKTVIDHKSAEWKADPKYYKYLRPETLFGTKFESYLQNATTQPKNRPQMPRN